MMKALRGLKAALNSRGQYKYKVDKTVLWNWVKLECAEVAFLGSGNGCRSFGRWWWCVQKSANLNLAIMAMPVGVVGLAIARQLSMTFPEKTTYLVERNSSAGQEIRQVVRTRDTMITSNFLLKQFSQLRGHPRWRVDIVYYPTISEF